MLINQPFLKPHVVLTAESHMSTNIRAAITTARLIHIAISYMDKILLFNK